MSVSSKCLPNILGASPPGDSILTHTWNISIINGIFKKFVITDLVPLLGCVHVLVVVLDAGEDAEEDELLAGDADWGPSLHHPGLYPHLRQQVF